MPSSNLQTATGADVRAAARNGDVPGTTAGLALGYAQANLVVLPRELAFDFLLFCRRNPKPCPVLDVTDPGSAEPKECAPTLLQREKRARPIRSASLVVNRCRNQVA